MLTSEDILPDYHPLKTSKDLDPLMERIANSKYVLLGEAFHGTHGYYMWRSAISNSLIEEKGFSFTLCDNKKMNGNENLKSKQWKE
jgi:erythromycin esterase-like protein